MRGINRLGGSGLGAGVLRGAIEGARVALSRGRDGFAGRGFPQGRADLIT